MEQAKNRPQGNGTALSRICSQTCRETEVRVEAAKLGKIVGQDFPRSSSVYRGAMPPRSSEERGKVHCPVVCPWTARQRLKLHCVDGNKSRANPIGAIGDIGPRHATFRGSRPPERVRAPSRLSSAYAQALIVVRCCCANLCNINKNEFLFFAIATFPGSCHWLKQLKHGFVDPLP